MIDGSCSVHRAAILQFTCIDISLVPYTRDGIFTLADYWSRTGNWTIDVRALQRYYGVPEMHDSL